MPLNLRSSIITDDEENTTGLSIRRKRSAAERSNLHSSMVTVSEDFAATLADNDHQNDHAPQDVAKSSSRGSMLDDSVRSEHSLVNKMQTALNEEWWTKRQQEWRDQKATPVKAVLQTEEDIQLSQQQKSQKRSGRADCIFGMLLLIVGFVVGGVFIHRDKIIASLMGEGGSGGGHASPSGVRQLPLHHHEMSYEERQQFYREQRKAGMLRETSTGSLGVDQQLRQQYVQYGGNEFQGERHLMEEEQQQPTYND
jgi:hypothetical protein